MILRPLIASACILTMLGGGPPDLTAQAKLAAQFNWRTQSLDSIQRVNAGTTVMVRIVGVSLLCYDYVVTINQNRVTEQTLDLARLMGGLTTAGDLLGTAGAREDPVVPQPKNEAQKLAADLLQAAVESSAAGRGQLQTATALVAAMAAARKAAQDAMEAYYKAACVGRGGPAEEVGKAREAAEQAGNQFIDLLADTKPVETALDHAKRHVDEVARALRRIRESKDPGFVEYRAVDGVAVALSGLEDFVELNAPKVEARRKDVEALKKDRVAVQAAVEVARKNPVDQAIARTVSLYDNTESVDVTIAATGKESMPLTKGVKHEDKFSFQVHRRNRFFLSGGVLISRLDEHRFDRVNVVDTTLADGAYSTFVDKRGSSSLAFAPTILGNLTLGELRIGEGVLDLMLSSGAAIREVAGRTAPDFVAGLSAGVGDRVVVSVAWHIGRVEQLLIGDPATIKEQPVPESITRDAAVGEKWGHSIGVIFSYRIR